MRLSFLLSLALCLPAHASVLDSMTGAWVNNDLTNSPITEIIVRDNGGKPDVQVWDHCEPLDCAWENVTVAVSNGLPTASEDMGFAVAKLQLIPQDDGTLGAIYYFEGPDHKLSPRGKHIIFFSRQTPHSDTKEEAAARTLLRQTADLYRGMHSARIKSTSTLFREGSTTGFATHSDSFYIAPNRMRTVITGDSEPYTIIRDGSSTDWFVYPRSNEYTSAPDNSPSQGFPDLMSLDSSRGRPTIARHEPCANLSCTVVHIEYSRGIQEEVWIDDATHLVRKTAFFKPDSNAGGSREFQDMVYEDTEINARIDPALFHYDPSATKAQDRTRLMNEAPVSMLGKPAPDFELRDLQQHATKLTTYRGKVLLLDFWGAWCAACREALPAIDLLSHSAHPDKLQVLGIDNEEAAVARNYLKQGSFSLPTLMDPNNSVATLYHIAMWPTTIIIDQQGKIAYYGHADIDTLHAELQKLGAW